MGTKKFAKKGGKAKNPQNLVINRNGLNPFPSRYRTQQTAILSGTIPIGSVTNVLRFRASPFLPFSGGSWQGVLTASITLLDLVGFGNLCTVTGPYTRWCCYGMKCRITMMPSVAIDTIGVSLGFQDVGLAVPSGYADSSAEPFYKSMLCQAGSTTKTLHNATKIARLAGFGSDHDVKLSDNLSGSYSAYPASTLGGFVTWGCLNGAANTGTIAYEFELTIDVEYYNEAGGALLDLKRTQALLLNNQTILALPPRVVSNTSGDDLSIKNINLCRP